MDLFNEMIMLVSLYFHTINVVDVVVVIVVVVAADF